MKSPNCADVYGIHYVIILTILKFYILPLNFKYDALD